ncbi:TOMM precursor leader peptide-binding protein [Hyalangium versicolor]|uniref:TOMM precursor leader peptide-binding protein n=1 Tax=Hyalangium versicolor TaxID=2861190 RepID=UPI001CC9089B|nr:TOMM precursor leader peptide-binding protein [Hyalangium versicolor]
MSDVLEQALQLKPHLRLERVDENRVVLLGEREHYLLVGRPLAQVTPLLDGRRTGRELLAMMGQESSLPEVLYALSSLHQAGYLTQAIPQLPPEQAALWQSLGVDPREAARHLLECTVSVRSQGLDPEPLQQALAAAGIRVGTSASQVEVVLVQDYLELGLEEIHRSMIERGTAWVPLKPGGTFPWVGPLFRPGAGPCWACLTHRLRANRPVEEFLSRRSTATRPVLPPTAGTPASVQAALSLAAFELARWVAQGRQSRLDTRLLTLELHRLRVEEHVVVKRPQCPACGEPELLQKRAHQPLVLKPRRKRFEEDGGYRCMTPEETTERLEHLISPITGVVCSLGPVPDRDHALRPVYAAVGLSRPPDDLPCPMDFHWTSAGKGRTAAQARASALCEALERYSAIFQGDEPRFLSRLSELGAEALPPNLLLNFSQKQYAERDMWNSRHLHPKSQVPLPFNEHAELEWTPVWSLTHHRKRYAPTAYCYTRYPARPEQRFFPRDSNGHAAGNCLEEAILQGFLELVERDAVAIWWYNRLRRPPVELRGFDEPYFQELAAHYRSLGWMVWALDLTHDLGIPVFAALGTSTGGERFCIGLGAHIQARLALQRALTEFNQVFDPRQRSAPPWNMADVEDPSWLYPDPAARPRTAADFAVHRSKDLREDISTCVERAARSGLETLVLDQTRPDIGLSAVKVIVPGLRHFWPRFGPGRLYEVPVHMGWSRQPLAESALNPLPCIL